MDRPMPRGVPRTPISGMPRKVPSHLERVTVRDPKTGKTQTHMRQNATDLVRHQGWVYVTTTAPPAEEVMLADGRKVIGESHHGDADAEAGQEARTEDEQDITAEAAEELAKAALDAEGTGGEQPGASESDTEVVSKLDQLRERAESLGVNVDKRWGSRRLEKEIDQVNSAL